MFTDTLKNASFRAVNGEYGWTRSQVPEVVEVLREKQLAILGGELWWVLEGSNAWSGVIPQRNGPDAVFAWETKRRRRESWPGFVARCAADTLAAVTKWPRLQDLPEELPGQILYNLTWVDESEYGQLGSRAG